MTAAATGDRIDPDQTAALRAAQESRTFICGKEFIMWLFKFLPGWATPEALRTDYASLASALRHRDAHGDCLPRRQGRCPGPEYCADCAWKEGTSREHG